MDIWTWQRKFTKQESKARNEERELSLLYPSYEDFPAIEERLTIKEGL